MKKIMFLALAAIGVISFARGYTTIDLTRDAGIVTCDAKVLALDVLSTARDASVTVSVVRAVNSYTNCVKIAVVTNGIGEVSTVTNRWMGLKERCVYTNALGNVTCDGGVGRADINKFVFGGDSVVATGINKSGETVKAKLIIEK